MKAKITGRRERDDEIAAPGGEKQTKRATGRPQEQAFDQELPNNLPARRADRRAHRELPRPRRSARGEQIREIDASNQQDHADRDEKQLEAGAIFANLIFEQAA